MNDTHLTIHLFSQKLKWNDLALIGYTGAAEGDRVDGSSTGGYVLTMAPYKQFIEGHMIYVSLIGWSTNKLKRLARSSLSAGIQQACNTSNHCCRRERGVRCVTEQQFDSSGADRKTKCNRTAGTQRQWKNTTRIFGGVTATFSWLTV